MPMSAGLHRQRAHRMLLAAWLAVSCAGASAGNGPSPRQALAVGLDHVAPEYKAGSRFRSPATIDAALAEDLARRMNRQLAPVRQDGSGLRLTTVSDGAAAPRGHAMIAIDYRAAPMAIMRTDTAIRRWEQLQGRSICVARDGNHAGHVAARYGAIEKIYPSLADALIAVRSGACDALVHDSALLEQLIRLPEWQKFSARLPHAASGVLAFLVPAADRETVALLRQAARDWKAGGYPQALVKERVRHIAFEVYLEQDVPDCH
jgi:polar amino acid transport system substrate-binding protein